MTSRHAAVLRRHVGERSIAVVTPPTHFRLRQGDPEVRDKRLPIAIHQNIGWLDVPVKETLLVGMVKVAGNFGNDPTGFTW